MYTHFFQLKQPPFSIAPDPRYLFMSERHREALAHLLYGVDCGGGFVLLTGEIGAGKTTVCRCLLEQIPENCRVAYVFNPKLSVIELLQSICEEFGIDASRAAGAKGHVDALNAYLLQSHAAGRNNVLIIDEAQNLATDVLEQLRLLTNLETSERKLLQIILIGQPELRAMLARPELEQLAQRVIARYHLGALSLAETAGYIQHRLASAGLGMPSPFAPALMPQIHRITRGVPRRINLLCDRALLGAYAAGRHSVTRDIVAQAAREVFDEAGAPTRLHWPRIDWARFALPRWQYAGAGLLTAALLTIGIAWGVRHRAEAGPAPAINAQIKLSHSLANVELLESAGDFSAASARKPRPLHELSGMLTSAADEGAVFVTTRTAPDLAAVFNTAMREERHAYRYLGQIWGVALKAEAPCRQLESRNIRCYQGSGSLEELRRLNRPAILLLRDTRNARAYALLTSLSATTATLRVAGERQNIELPLAALANHFRGEYVTFWRAPPAHREKIRPGARGEDVDWLATQLSRLDGTQEVATGQAYSEAMVRRLRAFQSTQGLPADGVAGPKTLMLLNNAVALDEPHMQPLPGAATLASRK